MNVDEPHPARRYNYWLGGKDNFAADRASADLIEQMFPWVRISALANRAFLGRAVRTIAEQGVVQFLDVGTGLPAPGNTHEVAQRVAPQSRVLYVDNDPLVMTHSRALTIGAEQGRTDYIEADLRDPRALLDAPAFTATLDKSQPVGVILMAVLHFVHDFPEALSLVRTLLDAVPVGSYLALSHGTSDFTSPTEKIEYEQMYADGKIDIRTRTQADILRFVEGMQILDPGCVAISQWRPHDEPDERPTPSQVNLYGLVAKKIH